MQVDKTTIKNVCDFIGGSQPPKSMFKSQKEEGYIRLIQTRDYKTDNFITYIPINTTEKFCNKDDIMIGRYGPPIFQILRGLEGAYNVALMKAVPKSNINNDYLFYFLKQDSIFKYIDRLSLRTGGQTGVDLISLNKYPILLPSLPYQKKVVDLLKSLDNKIEINNRINSELEMIAKILYDYWFVQFDFPDDNGKPYKTRGGKMVWNENLKRKIPDGWTDGTFDNIGEIIGGSTPSKEKAGYFEKNGTGWITPKDLSINSCNKFITKGETDVSESGIKAASLTVMPKGTVLLSSRAPIGYMAISRGNITTNQGFKSFIPKRNYSTPFVYYTIKNSLQTIINNASGSTFKEISGSTLKSIKTCLPNSEIIRKYTIITEKIFDKQSVLELENQELANTRDWLLPMLMNGQVKIKEAARETITHKNSEAFVISQPIADL